MRGLRKVPQPEEVVLFLSSSSMLSYDRFEQTADLSGSFTTHSGFSFGAALAAVSF